MKCDNKKKMSTMLNVFNVFLVDRALCASAIAPLRAKSNFTHLSNWITSWQISVKNLDISSRVYTICQGCNFS